MKSLLLILLAVIYFVSSETHPPYLVAIQEVITEGVTMYYHKCSGVILSPFWVLTSAACSRGSGVRPPFPTFVVVAGTSSLNGTQNRQEIEVELDDQIRHPFFDKYDDFSSYDLALFLLKRPLKLNQFVRPVQLPKGLTSGEAVLSGWGPSDNQSKSVTVPLINSEQCETLLHNLSNKTHIETSICSGPLDGTTGSCFFDRGSPLVQNGTLVGLVSWGAKELKVDCDGLSWFPSVYSDVNILMDFLEDYLEDLKWPPCNCN